MTKQCIDKVQNWLAYMGIKGTHLTRKYDTQLIVTRRLPGNKEYTLYIWSNDDDSLIFQTLAFKLFRGNAEQESRFYQILLRYNGLNLPINFGIIRMQNESEWGVVLTHTSACYDINPEKLHHVIQSFDKIFMIFVPHLKRQITSSQLDFTGQLRDNTDLQLE